MWTDSKTQRNTVLSVLVQRSTLDVFLAGARGVWRDVIKCCQHRQQFFLQRGLELSSGPVAEIYRNGVPPIFWCPPSPLSGHHYLFLLVTKRTWGTGLTGGPLSLYIHICTMKCCLQLTHVTGAVCTAGSASEQLVVSGTQTGDPMLPGLPL